MAEQIRTVFEIDYQQLAIWIAVLAAAFWAVKTLFGKILDWLGIETKWDREKREQRETIRRVADAMDEIKMTVQAQSEHSRQIDEITAMQIRHDLVESCEAAIHAGEIPSQVLKSIEDLYYVYHDPAYLGKNSYVSDLVNRVRSLKITCDTGSRALPEGEEKDA